MGIKRGRAGALFASPIGFITLGLLLTSCGNGPTTATGLSPNESSSSSQAAETSDLPTPPSSGLPEVRDISDVRLPLDPTEGGPPPPTRSYEDYDVDKRDPASTISVFYGYTGPLYSQLQWDRGMTVLEQTVGVDKTPTWGADLLVRNDSLETVGAIKVEARLIGSDGQSVGTVVAASEVRDARPGEPVPVSLESDVERSAVSEVRWSASASQAPASAERHLTAVFGPPLPYGEREPLRADLYDESKQAAPYPYIAGFDVRPTSKDIDLVDITNVVAWMDDAGRVLEVVPAQHVSDDQTPDDYRYGAGYIAPVADPEVAHEVADAHVLWWGVGWTK